MQKVLGKRVLVQEIAIKKEKKIISLKENKDDDYTAQRSVMAIGDEVTDIKVGDIPAISLHAKPHYIEIIEQSENKIISNLVFYSTDIVGVL